ncbi:GRAM domain containing protein [Trypanosoma conorhini]|uniref:GRAM domain containing protein n=1 Tax=Trypanosoma conorhini TaxID=83891 RepID=A0A3R7N809_9TRYP|nr:GRAM domain containing protein [Trypanosoma conorhini]RNF17788.1 GRAM domain containing protein [Trypanosoma conorhini]
MDRWVGSVETVAGGVSAVDAAVEGVVQGLLGVAEQYAADVSQVEAVGRAISHGVANSSAALVSCLADLATMSTAMKDAMDANPGEAHSLLMNLFGVFVKQLTMYYKESFETFRRAEVTLRQQQILRWNQRSDMDNSTSTNSNFTLVTETRPSLGVAPPVASGAPKGATKESAGGRQKKAHDSSNDNPVLLPSEPKQQQQQQQENLRKGKSDKDTADEYAFAPRTTAENEATQKEGQGDTHKRTPPSTREVVAVQEPTYLHVVSTVEDALGRLVLSSRPNVFSAPELIERQSPIASYYVKLPAPGSLGSLLLSNYIALGDDMQADLMCDILQTDCVEVEPFESPAGEIFVEDPLDLRELPPCGWRMGSSEDHQQMLYTLYVLIIRGAKMSPTLLIQESLVINSEREEVVHEITPVPEAPQIAKVTVRGFDPSSSRSASPSKRYKSERLLAIVNITKNTYERNGFVEVKKEEVNAVVQQLHTHDRLTPREEALLTKRNAAVNKTAAAFQGTVELASLEQPGEQEGWGLSDVAKGAVRGAAAVVLAPVSVGKAVGNAVLDVSGVTGAIKQQMEGVFRKSFPNLASEDIIETFNCALVDEGNPLPKQGFMFITPRWLCFQAGLLSANFSLEWDEIRDIKKQRTAKVLENAIAIHTHLGGTYFLTSFLQRDHAYSAMMKQWLRK